MLCPLPLATKVSSSRWSVEYSELQSLGINKMEALGAVWMVCVCVCVCVWMVCACVRLLFGLVNFFYHH